MTMYDCDLRAWYRDLFLHSPLRRGGNRHAVRSSRQTVIWDHDVIPEADLATAGAEIQRLRKHECPQATC
jgi:hypothetical protein